MSRHAKRKTDPERENGAASKRLRERDTSSATPPSTQSRPTAPATTSDASKCAECGSADIIEGSGDVYCGECGAVVSSVVLTNKYSFDAEQIHSSSTYIRQPHIANLGERASERLSKRWNQMRLREIHECIRHLCAQLEIRGIEERANHIFIDMAKRLADSLEAVIFGRPGRVRAAASVYIAAIEDSKPLTVVDIASAAGTSFFVVGRAVKEILGLLDKKLPMLDPLLRVERVVNRVFGRIARCCGDVKERVTLIALISGTAKNARGFPELLLEFLGSDESLRPRIIDISGRVMAFIQSCSQDTGNNPNSIACAAVSVAIEHFFVADDDTALASIKKGQRDVIFKLIALPNAASEHTISKHVRTVLVALARASETTPWLKDMKVAADTAAVHLPDILSCYEHARSLLFNTGLGPMANDWSSSPQPGTGEATSAGSDKTRPEIARTPGHIAGLVTELSEAPTYKRARNTRERRLRILRTFERDVPNSPMPLPASSQLHADEDEHEKEVALLKQLYELGVDNGALLSLPPSTLEQIASAAARSSRIAESNSHLDSPNVGPEDMSEEELLAYLEQSPSE
ncbi:hypothetical protein GQ54DRAFT_296846 [Martensiomyces pterosporus]|nr:hypothetical protein GQ54DRAFT_296846 [Martensiomyces pterosporus]